MLCDASLLQVQPNFRAEGSQTPFQIEGSILGLQSYIYFIEHWIRHPAVDWLRVAGCVPQLHKLEMNAPSLGCLETRLTQQY